MYSFVEVKQVGNLVKNIPLIKVLNSDKFKFIVLGWITVAKKTG